jgi:hypothetical protein
MSRAKFWTLLSAAAVIAIGLSVALSNRQAD